MSDGVLLVTGGMGFIGSNFVRFMVGLKQRRITVLDKLTYAGNPANLRDLVDAGQVTFVRGDICDPEVVDPLVEQADAVVNFAAETHVDRSIHYGLEFARTDVYGTGVLLEAIRKHGARARFVQVSTDEVYGEAPGRPSREDDPLFPKSPYAASKAGADRLAWSYFATHGLDVVITRCSNNYGPRQYPEKLIPLFVTNALEDKPLPVYGHGNNTRDWIHVDDHANALDMVLDLGKAGEVYNIGTGVERSPLEIARAVLGHLGKPESLVQHVEDRKGHVARHAVDSAKLRRDVGWGPDKGFDEALKATVEWYRDHPEWWRPLKSGEFRSYYERQYGKVA
jgi:dTDP-glucose 4,6-dehydratase